MKRRSTAATDYSREGGCTTLQPLQMMHVSGHKTVKTFRDYIKFSSDEIADEIDAIVNGTKSEVF